MRRRSRDSRYARRFAQAEAKRRWRGRTVPGLKRKRHASGTSQEIRVSRALTVAGVRRTFLLYSPARPDSAKPAPLILAFHGGGSSPEQFAKVTLLNGRAGAAGFVVAHPEAHRRLWNTKESYTGLSAGQTELDDVAFAGEVIDDIASVLPIDPEQVFVCGFSNGGKMAYRVACELADRIAAVGVVSSSLGTTHRRPTRPVPVLHLHGTADTIHPFEGGHGAGTRVQAEHTGVRKTIAKWIEWNHCASRPDVTRPTSGIRVETYRPGRGGAGVQLYIVEGMGHQWPGGTVRKPPDLAERLGPGSDAISATDLIVEFFLSFVRNRTSSLTEGGDDRRIVSD